MAAEESLRRPLLILVALGLGGTLGELLLIPHLEDRWQLVPIVATLGALSAIGFFLARPGPRTGRLLFATFAGLAAAGLAGLGLHLAANLEFEREVSPGLGGVALLLRAVHGTAPPSLAPGALVEFALLGALALWRHPLVFTTRPRRSP